MKRLLALILALTMMLCALASCGDNASNNDDEEDTKKKTYKVDYEEENKEKNDGEDKENNEKTESETKNNTDPILNHLLTNPEYKELIQKAVNDYEFSKTANFDPHPYAYLEKKGYDVTGIKNGTLQCKTVSYILDEKPNSIFMAVRVYNTNYVDHIFLEFNVSDTIAELYKDIYSRRYAEMAFMNDALSKFEDPVNEIITKIWLDADEGLNKECSRMYNSDKPCSILVKDVDMDTDTFNMLIIPGFFGMDKKVAYGVTVSTLEECKTRFYEIRNDHGYYDIPGNLNGFKVENRATAEATVYHLQDFEWTYSTLDFEKDYGNK